MYILKVRVYRNYWGWRRLLAAVITGGVFERRMRQGCLCRSTGSIVGWMKGEGLPKNSQHMDQKAEEVPGRDGSMEWRLNLMTIVTSSCWSTALNKETRVFTHQNYFYYYTTIKKNNIFQNPKGASFFYCIF